MQVIRPLYCAAMLAFGAVLTSVSSPVAMAEGAPIERVPLVVIRFNQPSVYFDQQLYGAIAKAIEVKPDVMFDVVAMAPASGDAVRDAHWVKVASHNAQRVVASMQHMGVPMERMRVIGRIQQGLRYDETQVFAY